MSKSIAKNADTSVKTTVKQNATEFIPKAAKRKQTAIKQYEAKIARYLELEQSAAPFLKEMEEIKIYFLEEFKNSPLLENQVITPTGVAKVVESNSYSLKSTMLDKVKTLLGKKIFPKFVTEKTTYGVSTEFKKALKDDDFDNVKELREAVQITTKKTFTVKAAK